MHRQKSSAIFHSSLKPFCLVLRDSHPDQSTHDTAHCAAHPEPGERSHNGARSNQWTYSRNCQSADASQQAECSSDNASSGNPSGGSFGCLGVFLVGECLGALVV